MELNQQDIQLLQDANQRQKGSFISLEEIKERPVDFRNLKSESSTIRTFESTHQRPIDYRNSKDNHKAAVLLSSYRIANNDITNILERVTSSEAHEIFLKLQEIDLHDFTKSLNPIIDTAIEILPFGGTSFAQNLLEHGVITEDHIKQIARNKDSSIILEDLVKTIPQGMLTKDGMQALELNLLLQDKNTPAQLKELS